MCPLWQVHDFQVGNSHNLFTEEYNTIKAQLLKNSNEFQCNKGYIKIIEATVKSFLYIYF